MAKCAKCGADIPPFGLECPKCGAGVSFASIAELKPPAPPMPPSPPPAQIPLPAVKKRVCPECSAVLAQFDENCPNCGRAAGDGASSLAENAGAAISTALNPMAAVGQIQDQVIADSIALKVCPDCKTEYKGSSCPNCGAQSKINSKATVTLVLMVAAMILLLFFIMLPSTTFEKYPWLNNIMSLFNSSSHFGRHHRFF